MFYIQHLLIIVITIIVIIAFPFVLGIIDSTNSLFFRHLHLWFAHPVLHLHTLISTTAIGSQVTNNIKYYICVRFLQNIFLQLSNQKCSMIWITDNAMKSFFIDTVERMGDAHLVIYDIIV